VRQALALAAAGVIVGAATALLTTRLLTGLLFEVRANDPITYSAIACLLGATAALAAWRPARRAATLDPITALRAD
jgi:ABC-type antimicrobial peptide transport system permease subunit